MMIHRRKFMQQAAALIGAGSLSVSLPLHAATEASTRLGSFGVNLFSIPKLLEKDFAATMQMLARLGYKEIEFFGPYPFSPQAEKDGWNAITPSLGFSGSGFFGLDIEVVKDILDDNGLSVPSMHSGLPTLQNAIGNLSEAATILGAKYVTLPSAATQPTIDDYKKQADEFNDIGKATERYGIRFAYHNHGNGLKELNGRVPFDVIMENTDPKLVFFQMDIFWMTAGGVDLIRYLDQYKGRFRLMHVKDMAKEVRFKGDGGDPAQWIELFPFLTNAGSGVLDLKTILPHAKKSGVEHFIVERDMAPDPENDLKASIEYLDKIPVK